MIETVEMETAMIEKSLFGKVSNAFAGLLVAAVLGAAPLAAETANNILLRVNDEILTLYDYEQRKAGEITALLADPTADPNAQQAKLAQVGRQILKEAFQEMLLRSRAEQIGIRVDESEIEASIREVGERQGLTTMAEIERALGSYGMSLDRYRETTRANLIINQVMGREVWSRITLGDEVLRAHYRNHREDFLIPEERELKEVLVLESSGLGEDELASLAQEVRARVVAEGLENAVVETYKTEGKTTGVVDLGWLRADELEESLSEVAWSLEPGTFSQPVKARGGYHIVHVGNIKEERVQPFNEVEDEIRRRERTERFSEELESYLAELERDALIVENLPSEAEGYRNLAEGLEPEPEFDFFGPTQVDPETEETSGDETGD